MNLALKLLLKNPALFFKEKHYRSFYAVAARLGNKSRFTPGTLKINGLVIHYCDALSLVWQYNEIFKEQYYYFSTASKAPLIYDCGSNIGTSCLYFKKLYPQATVKAFEADPTIAEILRKNMADNHLENVEVTAKAVWVDDNGIELTPDGADGASVYTKSADAVKIASVRLKELLDREERTIDFLKMDIEGAEKQVIADCGNSLQKIEHLFIEYHDFPGVQQDLDALLAVLTSNGFQYYIINAQVVSAPFKMLEAGKNLQLNIFARRRK